MVFNANSLPAVNLSPTGGRFRYSLTMNSKDHGSRATLLFNAKSHKHEEGRYFVPFTALRIPKSHFVYTYDYLGLFL